LLAWRDFESTHRTRSGIATLSMLTTASRSELLLILISGMALYVKHRAKSHLVLDNVRTAKIVLQRG
jgi:hypothetical protein